MELEYIPGATVEDEETKDFVVLKWKASAGTVVPNSSGVKHHHTTAIISGAVVFDFIDRGELTLVAGDEIGLPIRRGYNVRVLEDSEVHCFYPKGPAAEEIRHLRTAARTGKFRAFIRRLAFWRKR